MRHYAENFQGIRVWDNNRIGGIHRLQYRPFLGNKKALDRKFAVQYSDNHVAVLRPECPIDYQQIAVVKSYILHAVALCAQEKVLALWAIRYSFKSSSCSA